MFIDCHCHLDIYSDIEIENIIKKCRKKGIGLIINNGVNSITNRKSLELSKKFKEIKCALGVYPIDALSLSDNELDWLAKEYSPGISKKVKELIHFCINSQQTVKAQ